MCISRSRSLVFSMCMWKKRNRWINGWMDGVREFSIYGNDGIYLLERERLAFESIISRSVGWYFFLQQICVCVCSCGVMWYVYARAHANKTRMYIIHTVKPLLLLLLIVSCASGFYFDISQCRQLLQLLFCSIRSIVYWCVYYYCCNSIHFVSCGEPLFSFRFSVKNYIFVSLCFDLLMLLFFVGCTAM